MKPFETKAVSKYGASMGRNSQPFENTRIPCATIRVCLQRVRLYGDYDKGGAYWGAGEPLWCAWNNSGGEGVSYYRAPDRETAKALVLKDAPNAHFYR